MEAPEMFGERSARSLDERFDVRGRGETQHKTLGGMWRTLLLPIRVKVINKIEQRVHEEKAARFERVDDRRICWRCFAQEKSRVLRTGSVNDLRH